MAHLKRVRPQGHCVAVSQPARGRERTGRRKAIACCSVFQAINPKLVAWVRAKFAAMIPDMPDWLRSPEAGGTAGIGGDSGYGGMAGAMDETAPFLVPAAPLRLRSPANGPSTNVNVGGITVNAAPGQSTEAVAREVRRQLSEASSIRAYLDDRGLHAD
jgi:hypothetical protein